MNFPDYWGTQELNERLVECQQYFDGITRHVHDQRNQDVVQAEMSDGIQTEIGIYAELIRRGEATYEQCTHKLLLQEIFEQKAWERE